jgi:hypothetical protein
MNRSESPRSSSDDQEIPIVAVRWLVLRLCISEAFTPNIIAIVRHFTVKEHRLCNAEIKKINSDCGDYSIKKCKEAVVVPMVRSGGSGKHEDVFTFHLFYKETV